MSHHAFVIGREATRASSEPGAGSVMLLRWWRSRWSPGRKKPQRRLRQVLKLPRKKTSQTKALLPQKAERSATATTRSRRGRRHASPRSPLHVSNPFLGPLFGDRFTWSRWNAIIMPPGCDRGSSVNQGLFAMWERWGEVLNYWLCRKTPMAILYRP